MFKDALGREIQIPTIQLDFATPKRFNLYYIDENGEKQTPVMIHRAILGSYERFLVLLLEQFKGILPLFLSPVQVNIIPISVPKHGEYSKNVLNKLLEQDIRAELDDSNERMNKKIKISSEMKNPYTIIIGDKEVQDGLVSYRKLSSTEQYTMKIEDFIEMVKEEIINDKKI